LSPSQDDHPDGRIEAGGVTDRVRVRQPEVVPDHHVLELDQVQDGSGQAVSKINIIFKEYLEKKES
jgi:hypothetical protein